MTTSQPTHTSRIRTRIVKILAKTLGAAALSLCLAANTVSAAPAPDAKKDLRIYFVDVEGGQATLFVTPAGQSLLIDTGWDGNNGRDADRIAAAAKSAGISKINYVLITHFHADHVGGVPQLVGKIPVETFIDHGENRESGNPFSDKFYKAYQDVLVTGKYKHIIAKPGDALPIQGMKATAVTADGNSISAPLPGAGGENAACKDSEKRPADNSENSHSLGTYFTFGKLKILDLGDLTWDKEMELMCPVNKIGKVEVYIVSHHGSAQSGSPALVHGISPRVAIMDNGAKKGGSTASWDIIKNTPYLEDFWQVHYSEEGGAAHNVANEFIANPDGPDSGNYLELIGKSDGSFDVFNSRTQQTERYAAK